METSTQFTGTDAEWWKLVSESKQGTIDKIKEIIKEAMQDIDDRGERYILSDFTKHTYKQLQQIEYILYTN